MTAAAYRGSANEYYARREWIYKQSGKPRECGKCETQHARKYGWVSISGKYIKDLSDWIRLCPGCAKKMGKYES